MNAPRLSIGTATIAGGMTALLLALRTVVQAQDTPPPAPAPEPAEAPAQTEMQKWIATTDSQWQAALKRDVTDVHLTELEKVKQQYVALLETAVTKASGAGDLDGAVALRNEEKRFAGTNLFPEQDEATDGETIKQIRVAVRAKIAKLEKDTAIRTKALHAKYDLVLAGAQTQLTKAQRIEDALLVRAKREEVAAAWITPAVAALGKSGEATQPGTAGKVSATGAPTPAPATKSTTPATAAVAANGKTFEMRMTGTTWSFPWDGKVKSIRFEENGTLAMDFLGLRRKWKTPSDGVIEAFAFASSEKDTIYFDASERTGHLTRRGKEYKIQRLK